MSLKENVKVVADQILGRSVRQHYWATDQTRRRWAKLRENKNQVFAGVVKADLGRFFLGRMEPETDGGVSRARAAVDWILRAQAASRDGGVSLGYFPCDFENGWRVSYPETTGYIITSLLQFSRRYNDANAAQQALRMANWEADIQMPEGAVQGGPVCAADEQTPCAFNTGMVLDGWMSAWNFSANPRFFDSARRAADWLVNDLTTEGYFKTNGQFVEPGEIKTYNVLCAWAIHRLGEQIPAGPYQHAAIKIVEAALRQQRPSGWFANNCLTRPEAPLLHTIAYTLQGILEVGLASRRPEFVFASKRAVDAILPKISSKGFIAGRFFSDWTPACFSSCLTGSAQLAILCYRLFEYTGERRYFDAGQLLVNYLKPLQLLNSQNDALDGALPGSFPLFGGYMTAGYPNWATKYLLDALMLQDRLGRQ